MKLELLRDGDKGTPLGTAEVQDGTTDISEALGEIEEQATALLEAEAEAAAEKQKALGIPAEEPEAAPKGAKTTAAKETAKT